MSRSRQNEPEKRRPLLTSARAGVAALLAVSLASPLEAHKLLAVARLDAGEVRIEAFYDDDTPLAGGKVTIIEKRPAKEPPEEAADVAAGVASGATDAKGFFSFRPARPADLLVVVEDGRGHRVELEIAAGKLSVLLDGTPPAAAATEPLAASPGSPLSAGPLWLRVLSGIAGIAILAALAHFISKRRRRRHAS
jgi:hypothetical protein